MKSKVPPLHEKLMSNQKYRKFFESIEDRVKKIRKKGEKHILIILENNEKIWIEITPEDECGELPLFLNNEIQKIYFSADILANSEKISYSILKDQMGVISVIPNPIKHIKNLVIRKFQEGETIIYFPKKEWDEFLSSQDYEDILINALKKYHNRGLSHNDINPSNILISGEDINLIDWETASSIYGYDLGYRVPSQPKELDIARLIISFSFVLRYKKKGWKKFTENVISSFLDNVNSNILVKAVCGIKDFYSIVDDLYQKTDPAFLGVCDYIIKYLRENRSK